MLFQMRDISGIDWGNVLAQKFDIEVNYELLFLKLIEYLFFLYPNMSWFE